MACSGQWTGGPKKAGRGAFIYRRMPGINFGRLRTPGEPGMGRRALRRRRQAAKCPIPAHAMNASPEPAVRAERLTKVYKTALAVDGISFALPFGSITGLLGGNGAGKTTTIAMLMGLTTPTSGTAQALGADM